MEILSKKNAFWGTVQIRPNMRFTVPDEIGAGLVSRGMAENISVVVEEMEKPKPKPNPKPNPKAKKKAED